MARKPRPARTRIIGPGGVFLKLDEADQRQVDAQTKKERQSAEAKAKAKTKKGGQK